ncbi:MAG: UDP-N-acetylglucosamine 2-epimerase [Syntrophales bacterium LBB04]|nr:UDP-N-acetylglucosamine 2-epimerase [Syntrophales bacterium LBB04]
MHKRKICVVTGARAEYGLLYWLIKEIQEDPELELQLVATGMHLSPEFGLTYRRIEEAGFRIDEKVEMLLSSDTPVGIAKSIGLGVVGFADALFRLKPDILVVLGDRYEIFAAVQAAMTQRIPIAHIHGGETTTGAIDEAMRHAITKMAHFHFTAAEPYRRRVIQLGESPKRVLNYGAPGLDNLHRMTLLGRSAFEKAIDFQLGKLSFLITYHSVTLSDVGPERPFNELLRAVDRFQDAKIILTKSNSDTAGRTINQRIDEYAERNPTRVRVFTSMGQLLYLSAVKNVDIVLGNSSSGLVEVPALHKPTVNIGVRQNGRLKADSVIDCEEKEEAIVLAIEKGLSPGFKSILENVVPPYGQGDTSSAIKRYLKAVSLQNILMKQFYDVNYDNQTE